MKSIATFNWLWPSDIIWRHRCGSTLAQKIAHYLMTSSHYLNQCWLRLCKVLHHLPESNVTASTWATFLYNEFENLNFWNYCRISWGQISWIEARLQADCLYCYRSLVHIWSYGICKPSCWSPLTGISPKISWSHLTDFSITIQHHWRFRFAVTSFPAIILQQTFAHDTTAVLSCHAQNLWPPLAKILDETKIQL